MENKAKNLERKKANIEHVARVKKNYQVYKPGLTQGWEGTGRDSPAFFCPGPTRSAGQPCLMVHAGLSRRFLSRSRLFRGFESRSQSQGFAGPGSRHCPGTTAHPWPNSTYVGLTRSEMRGTHLLTQIDKI